MRTAVEVYHTFTHEKRSLPILYFTESSVYVRWPNGAGTYMIRVKDGHLAGAPDWKLRENEARELREEIDEYYRNFDEKYKEETDRQKAERDIAKRMSKA